MVAEGKKELKSHVSRLEETVTHLTAERDDALRRIEQLSGRVGLLEKDNESLKREKEELLRRLMQYENPHTPPSLQKKGKKEEHEPKKRGAPEGHTGATRETPEPDETVTVTAERCPECGSTELGEPVRTEKKTIIDIPPPQKVKVTEYLLDVYRCGCCGKEFTARHTDCPQKGTLGIYMLVYITMLKYHLRGVIRKIQDFLITNNSFSISPMGINDALLRVGGACKSEYDATMERIRHAKWVHIDETGMRVNGDKWWLWIFRSNENDVLVVITDSRGRNVVREVMGDDFRGPAVVDGWKAYNYLASIQRCWAHLMREVDAFKETSEHGRALSERIHAMFTELKTLLESNPPMNVREEAKQRLDGVMEKLVEEYSGYTELSKPVTYIRNGLGHWYTCLLYPGMEPTNNLGEQAIREHVLMRKIIGTFRSENGSQNYQYIASLLATWKLKDMNMFEELEQLLRQQLCLSAGTDHG
jgi:transposase